MPDDSTVTKVVSGNTKLIQYEMKDLSYLTNGQAGFLESKDSTLTWVYTVKGYYDADQTVV